MSVQPTDAEVAERLGRRRTRVFPVLALFFIIQQTAYWSNPPSGRAVDQVRVGAWVVMAVVMLLVAITGGFWWRSKTVRAMLNDEQTKANRAAAMSAAFIASMAAAIVLYVLQGVLQYSAGEAIHLIVSAGLITLLVRFAKLEQRGHD